MVLDDWLLDWLPAHDVSALIFVILWSTGGLLIYRICRNALLCNRFIWAYILIFVSRLITITLVPLDPPKGLLELIDPLSNLFYGVGAPCITKDLFYSGHTSILVLIALCLEKPSDRKWAFLGATAVGGLLLIQHVHYTVDVLAAPLFSYAAYRISRRATESGFQTKARIPPVIGLRKELPAKINSTPLPDFKATNDLSNLFDYASPEDNRTVAACENEVDTFLQIAREITLTKHGESE